MVSVELALLASFVLVPLVLGAADAAVMLQARGRLDQAVHEALFYAWSNALPVSTASVQSAAVAASGTVPAVTATTAQYCLDPLTGYPQTGTPPQPVAGGCGVTTQAVETYLVVTASITITLPVSVPWTAQTVTLSASSRARVQ